MSPWSPKAGADGVAGAETKKPKSDLHGGDKDRKQGPPREPGTVRYGERSAIFEEAVVRARMGLFFFGVKTIDSSPEGESVNVVLFSLKAPCTTGKVSLPVGNSRPPSS